MDEKVSGLIEKLKFPITERKTITWEACDLMRVFVISLNPILLHHQG